MGDHDLAIVSNIIIFLSSLSFINFILPVAWQFVTIQSLAWFTGGTILVAGACVIITGGACIAALVGYSLVTLAITYFTTTFTWVSTLIFTPLSAILIIFIAKLARGQ
jgi:hypothetical protein